MRYTFTFTASGKKYKVSANVKANDEETAKYLFRGYLHKKGIKDVKDLEIENKVVEDLKNFFGF